MALAAILSRRLPAPFAKLARGLADPGQRDFRFWWLAVTVALALTVGLIVALALAPVSGLVALVAVSVWTLISKAREGGHRPVPARA
jgi:cobalamin synthase